MIIVNSVGNLTINPVRCLLSNGVNAEALQRGKKDNERKMDGRLNYNPAFS